MEVKTKVTLTKLLSRLYNLSHNFNLLYLLELMAHITDISGVLISSKRNDLDNLAVFVCYFNSIFTQNILKGHTKEKNEII